jgi:3-oxoacyl-[acyl-carrier-protein] synthase II
MTSGHAVVTGRGVVTPGGSSVEALWDRVLTASGTAAQVVTFPELPDQPSLACRAEGFDPAERLERHEIRRLDRSHQMALWAAGDAMREAGASPAADRCAVVVGIGLGSPGFHEEQYRTFIERGFRAVSPLAIPVVMPNSVAAHLAIKYGFTGPSITVTSACASGVMAIGEALWLLRTGRVDRVLVGGVDAPIVPSVVAPFLRMEAMTSRLDDPAAASRPFAADRDGFVLGEGAGFLVLDRPDRAQRSFGKVLGYATNSDAFHIVAPAERGEGAAACIRAALADAGVDAAEIGHVNAHGTSTELNDRAEAEAIAAVFGPRSLPVTASKGVLGHLIGAAGSVEALIAIESARRTVVPPVANSLPHDPELADLVAVADQPVPPTSQLAISNSFGFGGHNAVLVVSQGDASVDG